MLQIVAWHGRTLADHQQQLNTYGAQGYRALSLSLYNTPSDARYACVLIKRPQVVAEEMFSAMTAAQFQQTFNTMAAKGMGPHIVTATGPANNALYAASFIAAPTIPLTRTGLTAQEFNAMNQQATVDNLKLVWFDCYGSAGDERYIATWWPDPEMLAWNCDGVGEDAATAQQRFDGISKTWAHVAQFAMTPSGRVTSLYYDGLIGKWQVRFGLTSAEYQTLFDQQTALGLVPLRVCAKGEGDAARFGVVFAEEEQTPARVFTGYGPTTNASVDSVMKTFLAAHNIRSASLAIVAGTRLVYAKGYTWAQPGFPSVEPTTLFRQASCSKIFVAYSLYRLLQQRRDALAPAERKPFSSMLASITLQSVLNLRQPNGQPPADPKFAQITLLDLITSTSGLNQNLIFSSVAAAAAANHPLPATRMMLAQYVAAQTFSATPGDPKNVVYGNLDYFLLSEVVRAMSGKATFEEAVEALVCTPMQMTHVRGCRSLLADQAQDEALYAITQPPPSNESAGEITAAPSVRSPQQTLVPDQYGGFDWEMFSGCGGLSVAVTNTARLVASLSLVTNTPVLAADTIDQWLTNAVNATQTLTGPDAHGYHGWDWVSVASAANKTFEGSKGGSLPGTGTVTAFTTGGLSYIAFSADQGRPGVTVDWLAPLTQLAAPPEWATADLFPDFGMPSFTGQANAALMIGVSSEKVRSRPMGRMTPLIARRSEETKVAAGPQMAAKKDEVLDAVRETAHSLR